MWGMEMAISHHVYMYMTYAYMVSIIEVAIGNQFDYVSKDLEP